MTAERLLLDTCHRVELISVDDEPLGPASVSGPAAVRRFFTVVAGFDSAVVAEEQLIGQVREAYATALVDGSTGPILNELVRRALRFGRRVRSHVTPGADRSLAAGGVRWITERVTPGSAVIVAGTGQMGGAVATALAAGGHPVTVVSRSLERAELLVGTLPGAGHQAVAGSLTPHVGRFSAVVLAVRAAEPILHAADLGRREAPWILDLSLPPAVADDAARMLGVRLLNVDGLGRNAEAVGPTLPPRAERRLRRELEAEVDAFVSWLETRQSADAVAILHDEAEAVRRRHIARLRDGADLRPDQLAAVEAATGAMLRELLHRPSVELRRGAADAATVSRLFGVDRP